MPGIFAISEDAIAADGASAVDVPSYVFTAQARSTTDTAAARSMTDTASARSMTDTASRGNRVNQ